MILQSAVLITTLALIPAVTAVGQTTCTEPHYRWSEKIDASFATKTPIAVDVSDILNSWAPRSIARADKCAKRVGREKNVYAVTGWVRRIKKHETDHDWHIEITENEDDTPVKASCIIVEIPSPDEGAIYGQARGDLAGFVDTTGLGQTGDVDPPVRVTFIGAAFFDGYHQKKGRERGAPESESARPLQLIRARPVGAAPRLPRGSS